MSTEAQDNRWNRRLFLGAAAAAASYAAFGPARNAHAFGDEGAFNPRILLTGDRAFGGARAGAPARWAAELVSRTSAPARLAPTVVRADDTALLAEPFVVWTGSDAPDPLTRREVALLRKFIALGGLIVLDDSAPRAGRFVAGALSQLSTLIGHSAIELGPEDVLFRTYYLLEPSKLAPSPSRLRAIVRAGMSQVVVTGGDLLGALSIGAAGVSAVKMSAGAREHAMRLAVNIAMYVLCSNYKDDQVHAPFLMRHRAPTP